MLVLIMYHANLLRYNLGAPYWLADLELKVEVGPADLKFQLLGKNGQLNVAHEEIKVEWSAATADGVSLPNKTEDDFGLYRPN